MAITIFAGNILLTPVFKHQCSEAIFKKLCNHCLFILNVYCVPGTVLSLFYALLYLMHTVWKCGRFLHYWKRRLSMVSLVLSCLKLYIQIAIAVGIYPGPWDSKAWVPNWHHYCSLSLNWHFLSKLPLAGFVQSATQTRLCNSTWLSSLRSRSCPHLFGGDVGSKVWEGRVGLREQMQRIWGRETTEKYKKKCPLL